MSAVEREGLIRVSLGLAISRGLASLLGGEIQLRSEPGKGSSFTLYLPETYVGPSVPKVSVLEGKASPSLLPMQLASVATVEAEAEQIVDDRNNIQGGDSVLLVIEDDIHYARAISDLARQGVQSPRGPSWIRRPCLGPRIPSQRHFIGCLFARHAGLDCS